MSHESSGPIRAAMRNKVSSATYYAHERFVNQQMYLQSVGLLQSTNPHPPVSGAKQTIWLTIHPGHSHSLLYPEWKSDVNALLSCTNKDECLAKFGNIFTWWLHKHVATLGQTFVYFCTVNNSHASNILFHISIHPTDKIQNGDLPFDMVLVSNIARKGHKKD